MIPLISQATRPTPYVVESSEEVVVFNLNGRATPVKVPHEEPVQHVAQHSPGVYPTAPTRSIRRLAGVVTRAATGWPLCSRCNRMLAGVSRTEAATLPVRPRTWSSDPRHPLAIALIVPSRSCIAVDGSVDAAQA